MLDSKPRENPATLATQGEAIMQVMVAPFQLVAHRWSMEPNGARTLRVQFDNAVDRVLLVTRTADDGNPGNNPTKTPLFWLRR